MEREFLHSFDPEVSEEVQVYGIEKPIWRPAITMPFYLGRKLEKSQCGCGQIFDSEQAYKEHYVYYAVWENESDYIPQQIRQAIKATLTSKKQSTQPKEA